MGENDYKKIVTAVDETTKYRVLFSLYCAGGFLVLSWVYTYFGLIIYQKFPMFYGIQSGRIPPYPFGFYVFSLGVPIFTLLFWRVWIINFLGIKENSISKGFYVFFVFIVMSGLSLFNFGFNVYFIVEAIAYGVFFGLIDAIQVYKEDFSFLQHAGLSEAVKLGKLQMMHDRWFRYLIAVITLSASLIIGLGVQGIIATPEPVRGENAIVVAIIVGYLCAGIGLGALWDMFNKMNKIEAKVLEIRSVRNSA